MARPKGQPKSGGRAVGSINKRTNELMTILDELNYNPLRKLLLKYDTLSIQDQIKIDLKLLDFVYPRLREQNLVSEENEAPDDANNILATRDRFGLSSGPVDPAVKSILGGYDPADFLLKLAELSAEGLI